MSGPFEKYVENAAEAGWNSKLPTYWLDEAKQTWSEVPEWKDADENDKQYARETTRATLAAIGPLIQEDTRERMVAAAGAALEREGAGGSDLDSCIWVDPGRQSGQACFGGTRIPVAPFMAIMEEAGEDAAKAFWPGVTDAHIKAGRAYERGRREVPARCAVRPLEEAMTNDDNREQEA